MSARPKTPTHADDKHAILYGHPIPENSFAVRDLVHKLPGVGLFDLRRTESGAHACTFCGACQKACPVDCIDVRRDPSRSHGKGKERHFAGTITLDERRCITCDHCVEACKFDALVPTELYAEHRRRVQELAHQTPQLSSGHGICSGCGGAGRRQSGAEPGEEPLRRLRRHRLPRGVHDALPLHRLEGQLHPHQLRERRGDALRRRDRLPRAVQARQARGARQVHRLRRRRRHLRHRPAGALRRHGARPRHALRVLRQRRLHEHRLPALERDAARRLDDHEPGRRGAARQARPQQEPHRDHGGAPSALRGAVVAARPAGPHPQGVQGAGDRGPDVPQRALRLPARLAHRQRRGHRPHAPRHRDLLLAAVRGQRGRVPPHLPAAAQAAARQVAGAPGPLRPPGAPRQRAPAGDRSRSGSTSSGTSCCASATRSPRTSGTRRAAATRPSRS